MKAEGRSQRHIGMDALRLFSMLLVCLFHASKLMDDNPYVNALCCIAVNLFALISGYVCVQSGWKIKRYVTLWFQVAFYSVVFFVVGRACYETGLDTQFQTGAAKCLLPVPLAGSYWYFTAYTGLFMVMPFINKLVTTLSRQQFQALLILAVGCLSVLTGLRQTPELYSNGFNMAWLTALYLVGSYFKLYPVRWNGAVCVAVYLLCSAAVMLLKYTKGYTAMDYASPICLASSCAVFYLFARRSKWGGERISRILSGLAPYAFGVYLVHMHPYVWHCLEEVGKVCCGQEWFGWWVYVAAAIVLFTVCMVLDMCRAKLFGWLKVGALAERLAGACPALLRDLEKM